MDTEEYLTTQFKKLTTLFYAMLFGMLMVFGIAAILLMQEGAFVEEAARGKVISFWLPAVTIALLPISYFVYNNQTKKYREDTDLETKTDVFFRASIVRYAILEAAGTLAVVGFLLTYSRQNTYLFVAIMVIFLLTMPGPGRFINDLNIRDEEKTKVENILRRKS